MNAVLASRAADLEWEAVSSTNVKAIAYDDTVGRVFVEFLNGSMYASNRVPASVFAAFQLAPSKGRFVKQLHADYGYQRVR